MAHKYDEKNPISILNYAKRFEGKTFNEIKINHDIEHGIYDVSPERLVLKEEDVGYYTNTNAKGQLGGFIEKYGFGYEPNSKQEADFNEAGVELKQTCIDIKKNGEYTAGERLSITNISYKEVIDDFYKSHVWDKIKLILLIHYIRDKKIDKFDYVIKFVNLFTPTQKDLKIIIDDYIKINNKIKAGKAHELSEGDTLYLGACTKGATAEKSLKSQCYSNVLAKSRNYCFKRSYMDSILHEYILKNDVPFKLPNETDYRNNSSLDNSIAKFEDLENTTFEDLVINKLSNYIGMSGEEICEKIGLKYNTKTKDFWSLLTLRMLGVRSNRAEEFVKAGIVVKTIRVEENHTIREHMSFPTFEFMEIANQQWEDSWLFNYFSETKFLLTVYEKKNGKYKLAKIKFWNVPIEIIDNQAKECWLETQKIINEGVKFEIKGNTVQNNLPGSTFNHVVHVRPHATLSAYKLHDGYVKGNIDKDASMLPNGEYMTRQCFWLDKDYILKILGY